MKKLLKIFLLLFTFSTVFAQEKLTLEQAVQIALENNYSIKIARNDLRIADNNNTIGNAGFLPSVDASGSARQSLTSGSQEFIGDRGKQSYTNAKNTSLDGNIGLNWTIFDGMNMFINSDRLEEISDLSRLELKYQIENTIYQVENLYFDIVRQKKVLELRREAVELSQDRFEISSDKFDLGSASKLEKLQAQVDLNEDRSQLLDQEAIVKNLKISLNEMLARDKSIDFAVDTTINLQQPIELAPLKEKSLNENTEIRIAQTNITLSEIEKNSIESQYYPKFSLFANYGYNYLAADAGFLKSRTEYGFDYGLSMQFNIFNGFNTQRQKENAEIRIMTGREQLEQVQSAVESDLIRTHNDYTQKLQLVKMERENLSVAEENLDIAMERFQLGTYSQLELRQAQTSYVQAKSRYYSALYNAKTLENRLLLISSQIVGE